MTKKQGSVSKTPHAAFKAAVGYLVKQYRRESTDEISQNMVLLVREANVTLIQLAPYFMEKPIANASNNPARASPIECEPDTEDAFEDIQGIL